MTIAAFISDLFTARLVATVHHLVGLRVVWKQEPTVSGDRLVGVLKREDGLFEARVLQVALWVALDRVVADAEVVDVDELLTTVDVN